MTGSIICQTFLLAVGLANVAVAAERPNILLILSDDQAWTDYGFMGHPEIATPNLDRLATESLVFPRGYVASPLCRPSLASIVTGQYPHVHGVTGNDVVRDDRRAELDVDLRRGFHQHPSFVKQLVPAGYLAMQAGKWWEGSYQDGGFTHGMTHGDATRGGRHGDEGLEIGRETMQPIDDFLRLATTENKPFFLWYAPLLPHTPHNPPKRLVEKYTRPGRAEDVARYYATCEWFDATCGELLAMLERHHVHENTMVIYLCDNGWTARSVGVEHPHQKDWDHAFAIRSKGSPYENGIRTPILVSCPKHQSPGVCEDLAHAIDVYPTIAKAAGLTPPETQPGVDLLDPQATSGRKNLFGACHSTHNVTVTNPDETQQYQWCIQGHWKLLRRYHGADTSSYRNLHSWDTAERQLYDLKNDPSEQRDLAESHPQIVEELSRKIEEWHSVPSDENEP
jgi:arylsulfatase A-like enzyme